MRTRPSRAPRRGGRRPAGVLTAVLLAAAASAGCTAGPADPVSTPSGTSAAADPTAATLVPAPSGPALVTGVGHEIPATGTGVRRSRVVETDPGVLLDDTGAPRPGPVAVSMALFDDVVIRCTLTLDRAGTGVTSWTGTDDATTPRTVTVVLTGGAVGVRVTGTDRSFEVLPAGAGRSRVDEIDPAGYGPD